MSEHQYEISSWQSVTTEVKKALGIKQLSKDQAERLMKMYVLGQPLDKMISTMKGEKEWQTSSIKK